jgi:hypothetical protein
MQCIVQASKSVMTAHTDLRRSSCLRFILQNLIQCSLVSHPEQGVYSLPSVLNCLYFFVTDCISSLSLQAQEIFLFPRTSRSLMGPTQRPIQSVSTAFSPEVKRPGREADHSPPSSVGVKNEWSCTAAALYIFMPWVGTLPFLKFSVFPV